jgi:hypothetical protein
MEKEFGKYTREELIIAIDARVQIFEAFEVTINALPRRIIAIELALPQAAKVYLGEKGVKDLWYKEKVEFILFLKKTGEIESFELTNDKIGMEWATICFIPNTVILYEKKKYEQTIGKTKGS